MRIFWNGASSYGAIQTSSSSILALNPSGNNVAIGATDASKLFSVVKSIGGDALTFTYNTANTSSDNLHQWRLGSNCSNTTATYLSAGIFGVADRLYIFGNGNIVNTNGSYGTISSDRRLKENIKPATSKLDDLLKLNVVNFNLIGEKDKHIGFIAQEMQEVFPSFVYQNDTRKYDEDGNITCGLEDALGVKVGMEFAILVKAIQELEARIKQLENK
jgi:hypothetical protein